MATRVSERKRLVVKALRQVRAAYRRADTAGERVERELDRLIRRKTQIEMRSIDTLTKSGQTYYDLVNAWARDHALIHGAINSTMG